MTTVARVSTLDDAFRSAVTIFSVQDLGGALEFYRDRLCFSVMSEWDEPASYAIVRRGAVDIHLRECEADDHKGSDSIFIHVDDVDAVWEELRSHGNPDIRIPQDQSYGMRTIGLQDLDGHWLYFGSPVATE